MPVTGQPSAGFYPLLGDGADLIYLVAEGGKEHRSILVPEGLEGGSRGNRLKNQLRAFPGSRVAHSLRVLHEGILADPDYGPHQEHVAVAFGEVQVFETACATKKKLCRRRARPNLKRLKFNGSAVI